MKAYEHFNDPEWDGDPLEPVEPASRGQRLDEGEEGNPNSEPSDDPPRRKLVIKLADGKERTIRHMSTTTFWSPDGKPMSAVQFVERMFGELPELFKDEDELRKIWGIEVPLDL